MAVVLGKRNKGMNGTKSSVTSGNLRVFRFGNKGPLVVMQSCRTESTSEDKLFLGPYLSSSRILRAYFRKRAHSSVVGNLLKDFKTKRFEQCKTRVVDVLTVHLPPFQTSPGKDLSNGSSRPWVSHNVSNTGSSKLLQQHVSATAVALAFDATSSQAISLTISSTLRQACIGLGRRV